MALINWTRVFSGMTAPLMSYLDDNFNLINTVFGPATAVSQTPGATRIPIAGSNARLDGWGTPTPAAGALAQFDASGRMNTNAPTFEATLNANQTVTSGATTKVTFNTKTFDTNSNYDAVTNFRFTPTIAGKYAVSFVLEALGTTVSATSVAWLYKNGSPYRVTFFSLSAGLSNTAFTFLSTVVDMNGSTDYLEVFVNITGTGTMQVGQGSPAPASFWSASRVSI